MNAEANTDITSSDSLEEGQDDDGLYDYLLYRVLLYSVIHVYLPL